MRLRLPPTILFGRGCSAELPRLLAELGIARPLLVTDRGVAAAGIPRRLAEELAAAGLDPEVWDGAEPEPGEEHADRCAEHLRAAGHEARDWRDGIVAVGGGSAIDVAKVAAVLAVEGAVPGGRTADCFGFDRVARPGLPVVAVPTLPGSGAEVSSHAVLVARSPLKKEVVAGLPLLPRAAVVDPDLSATAPRTAAVHAALDAFIHAVEAYLARRATPFTDTFAEPAAGRIAAALPRALSDPEDAAAREELALGCLYAGCAMANANAGAIHALGYPLTGRHGIPHGLANALMAAATLERIWSGAPERSAVLARALDGGIHAAGAAGLPGRVSALLAAVGVSDTLRGWGVEAEHLPGLAEEASHFRPVLENAPVALSTADLLAIYREAYCAGC